MATILEDGGAATRSPYMGGLALILAEGLDEAAALYQILHCCARTMGWPARQANALLNSGMLETTPLMRYSSGECGLVMALARLLSARSSPQAHCAIPTKKR